MFGKQAELRRGAVNNHKLSSMNYFTAIPKPSRQQPVTPIPVDPVDSLSPENVASNEVQLGELDSSEWEDEPNIPVLPAKSLVSIVPASPDNTAGDSEDSDKSQPDEGAPDINSPADAAIWLDPTADDEYEPPRVAVGVTVAELIKGANKHKSFAALFKLNAVRNYLELLQHYNHVPNIKNPVTRASLGVAKAVGKGPYFAKLICRLVRYIDRFHTLPPSRAGKHQAHPSLLNNERIHQAVHRFLTVQGAGEVGLASVFLHQGINDFHSPDQPS